MRIGVDLGGTKVEAIALMADGKIGTRVRRPTPSGDYQAALRLIRDLVLQVKHETGLDGPIGIGIPGAISTLSGTVMNANSTWLIGRPLDKDLEQILRAPVRIANDANCFAISEAVDGAGEGAHSVFGIILGTGCGGGLVINQAIVAGRHGIAGEWGHNPLPWPSKKELPGPPCYCGKRGCLETWISGTGLTADFERMTGDTLTAEGIFESARSGSSSASRTLNTYYDRLARALAGVINIVDPDVIVIGGGLSNQNALYIELPRRLPDYVFCDRVETRILKNRHGDSSGVRGAAWLWPEQSGD